MDKIVPSFALFLVLAFLGEILGIDDVYAVIIGGEGGKLARYGRNPFPYKGIPYRAKSYDPHEYQPDGIGLLEQYRPVQEVVNNFLNMS